MGKDLGSVQVPDVMNIIYQILQHRPGPSSGIGFPLDISMAFPPIHPSQPGLIHPIIPNMVNSADILQRNIHQQLAPLNSGFKEPNQVLIHWNIKHFSFTMHIISLFVSKHVKFGCYCYIY